MTNRLIDLPIHIRKRLVSALETGLLSPPYSVIALQSAIGRGESAEDILAGLSELERLGVSGTAAANWLRSLDEILSRTLKPDLIWSGPEVPGIYARDTRRVYEELLGSAERSVWVCSYAYFDGPRPSRCSRDEWMSDQDLQRHSTFEHTTQKRRHIIGRFARAKIR